MIGISEFLLLLFVFSIETEIYYKLAGFLFLNLLLILGVYVLSKSFPTLLESQAVKLITKGIDFKTTAPHLFIDGGGAGHGRIVAITDSLHDFYMEKINHLEDEIEALKEQRSQ